MFCVLFLTLTFYIKMVICGESLNVKTAPRQMYKNPTAESCLGWDEIPASLKPTSDTLKTKKTGNRKIQQLMRLMPWESLLRGLLPFGFLENYNLRHRDRGRLFNIGSAGKRVKKFRWIQYLLFILASFVTSQTVLEINKVWSAKTSGNGIFILVLGAIGIGLYIASAILLAVACPKEEVDVRNFHWQMGEFFKCFPTLLKRFFECGQIDELRLLIDNHLVRIATELLELEIAHFSFDSPETKEIRVRFNQKFEIADTLGLVKPKKLYFLMAQDNIDLYQSFDSSI